MCGTTPAWICVHNVLVETPRAAAVSRMFRQSLVFSGAARFEDLLCIIEHTHHRSRPSLLTNHTTSARNVQPQNATKFVRLQTLDKAENYAIRALAGT
jgi:hypothetical protein